MDGRGQLRRGGVWWLQARWCPLKQIAVNFPKLLDQLRLKLQSGHYSCRTEQAYVRWVEKFSRYHRASNGGVWRHPDYMGKADVEEYLTHLAVKQNAAPPRRIRLFRHFCISGGTSWSESCLRLMPVAPSLSNDCRWCCRRMKRETCWRISDFPFIA